MQACLAILLAISLLSLPDQLFAQTTTAAADSTDSKIFDKVEIEASFPGGETAWRQFLEQNLNANTPVDHGAPAGSYTVWVQFIVGKDGKVSDLKMLTHHGYGMETEVMRILRKSPDWTPAEQDGRKVKAYRKQPVTFVIQEEKRGRRKKD
ncbi:MAG: energy transducer TonB [Chitinophagaceae bacterium]